MGSCCFVSKGERCHELGGEKEGLEFFRRKEFVWPLWKMPKGSFGGCVDSFLLWFFILIAKVTLP